jgi:hypothetical protein
VHISYIPEEGSDMFLWNVGKLPVDNMALFPRRQHLITAKFSSFQPLAMG